MATRAPYKNAEDSTHGEEEKKPLFPMDESGKSGVYDDQKTPLGDASDPRGDINAQQRTPSGDSSDPRGQGEDKVSSPSDLRDAEVRGDSGPSMAIGSKERDLADKSKGFYNPGDTALPPQAKLAKAVTGFFKTNRRKKTAAGGVIGGTVAVVILVASITQGPFQLIHFAQLLQKFHMQPRQDESSSRIVKTGRYMYHLQKSGSGVQNVRLGKLGNIYADRIEKKLNASGIKTAYTKKSGYRAGYIIDPDTLSGTDLDKYKQLDPKGNVNIEATQKAVIDGVEKEFGVKPVVLDDGTLFLDSQDNSFRKGTAFDKFILKRAGYGTSVSAVNARVMGKRAGLSWHPIKKLDRKLNLKAEDLYNKWREGRKNTVKNGAKPIDIGSGSTEDPSDTDGSKTQAAREASQTQTDTSNEIRDTGSSEGPERASKLDKLTNSKGFKGAAGSAAVIGVACLIKQVDDSADEVKEAQVILPAMRIAGDFMALGSQVQAGDDIDTTQLGFFAKQLNGIDSSGNRSSWTNAETTRTELGNQGGTKPTETLSTIGSGSPFAFINEGALGTAVGAACSTAGIIITSAIGVATGPISFAVGTAGSVILAPILMGQLVDWVSGNALNPLPVGADLGNTANFGGHLMARQQGISNGGRELSGDESVAIHRRIMEEDKKEFATHSLMDRLLDLKDSRSLVSRTLDNSPKTGDEFASYVSSPFKIFGSTYSSLFSNRVSASGSYDYGGVKDVGFSEDELNNKKVENPFESAEQVVTKILPNHPDYIERAKTCWGIEVDPASYDVTNLQAGTPTLKDTAKSECTDKSDDFLQFRMYVLDTNTMMSLACLESNDSNPDDAEGAKACADLGLGSGGSSNSDSGTPNETPSVNIDVAQLGKNSDKLSCAEGTKDLGVVTTKYTGILKKESGPLKIRLCQVKDIPGNGNDTKGVQISGGATVDARVSGAWAALAKAAKSANIPLEAGSSFRLADSCGGTGDGTACASPGNSPHQTGLAIDFGNGMYGTTGSSTTSCSGRAKLPGNKSWKWLHDNADKYGIKQYTFEAWHWDATGSDNRCGKNDG